MSDLQHDFSTNSMGALNQLSMGRDQIIRVNHGHVIQGAFARLGDAGIARDDQSDAPLNESPVKSELFFCRTSAAIGKPFMGSGANHAIGKMKGPYFCFRK
jgi:hypothetical protein